MPSRTPSLSVLLLAAGLILLSACPKRVESPTALLEDAAEAAQSPEATARDLALAGYHAWLLSGDPARARALFDASLEKDAGDPWALYGQVLFAQRDGHPARGLTAALELVHRAPSHPLSTAAARFALERVGISSALDLRIVQGAQRALEAHPKGDTAHLLRSALAAVHGQRHDAAAQDEALNSMGAIIAWRVQGPVSAFRLLELDAQHPPLTSGALDPKASRVLRFPDGRAHLQGADPQGDLFLFAADLEVPAEADYVLRSVSNASHKALLDGALLFQRRDFARAESTVSAAGVRLLPGRHRLLLLLTRDDPDATVSVTVMRADGAPSDVTFQPAEGPPPAAWGAELQRVETALEFADPADLARALEEEAGAFLARLVAVRDGMGRHPDEARRLMSELFSAGDPSAAVLSLRAELWLSDGHLPSRVAQGRATRDLEAALEKDSNDVSALLARAQLLLEDGRLPQARELQKRAAAAHTPVGYQVPLLGARLDLALGLSASARASAQEALAAQPGLCDAQALLYDLARRREAVKEADQRVAKLEGCPGARTRRAEHARLRGDLKTAIQLYEGLVARDPSQLGATDALAGLYLSTRQFDRAVALLEAAQKVWPAWAPWPRRLAEVHAYAGRPDAALKAKEAALALAGGDLSLRRSVHRAKTGKELLSEYAIDGMEAIRAYEANPGTENAESVLVLDAAAIQAFPDGSLVDRIHVIMKALSQEGVSAIAEVNLPQGAAVLSLRTIKKDGTVLEPERIAEKDAVSMPGVQVGDYVEYEYLLAEGPRGPAQPGFTAAAFYFQVAETPNHWSTYVVTAPKELGMKVDAHNVKSPQPKVEGDRSVYRHDERHVPPYIAEPDAPPNPTEYLPFVVLGAGTEGNDALVKVYADAFLDRGQLTWDVVSFARAAAEGKEGLEKVKAVHAAVTEAISGRDAGLTASAGDSLASGKGSRLWALKASLEAVGIPARLAVVRTFRADPSPYLFPNEALLPYLAVRAELPEGQHVWLDAMVRYGPFGQLPEAARDQEAWLLPEPGRPLEKVRTPKGQPEEGKEVTLALELLEDGGLRGEGAERYTGFDAAQVMEWMERLPPHQRKQALQGALARYFGGAELLELDLEMKQEVGGELTLRYRFRVPAFARREEGRYVLGPVTLPVQLGRRYLQLGSRTTPLFLESTELSRTRATLKLPDGYQLRGPVGVVTIEDDFGHFIRREKQEGDTVYIEEDFLLKAARLPPARYGDFSHFAGQVDLLQTRDLLVEKK